MTAQVCREVLLLLLRGAVFREGNQGSQMHMVSPDVGLGALRSIHRHALQAARALRWDVRVFAHVAVPALHAARFRAILVEEWGTGPNHVSIQPLLKTQAASLLAAIAFAIQHTHRGEAPWRAMLIVRVDLELKMPLPLPAPSNSQQIDIVVPFQLSSRDGRDQWTRQHHRPQVADTILLVPRCRQPEFVRAIAQLADNNASCAHLCNMHELCESLSGGVRYFLPRGRFDTNSAKSRNPLFRVAGRAEARAHVLPPHMALPGVPCPLPNGTRAQLSRTCAVVGSRCS